MKKYFLAWKLSLDAIKSLDSFTYFIDAGTGRVLKKYSNLRSQKAEDRTISGDPLLSKEETTAVLNRTAPSQYSPTSTKEPDKKKDLAVASAPPPASVSPAAVWETILSENFDVKDFPYSPWRAFDNNGSIGGEIYWDDQNCVYNDPGWSLWAADEGVNGLDACVDNYANNMDSWVVYGPFDLSNSSDGLLEFHYNNDSELNYDYFKWMASVDGSHFSGYQISGNSSGWRYESLDFKNVPTLGNITGRSQVWIAFAVSSDGSVAPGKGAFVDDVSIKKMSSSCTGVSGHVGGHIYGKNQNELQLRDFKNMKVVLNNNLASDSYAMTNSTGNYSSPECSDYIRFELEGYGANNFLKVHDCNDGSCPFGGDILASQDFPFASTVNFDWNVDSENKKEVNVFWHVNEIHDWYRSLLGQDLMNYQMQAYVDYVDFQINPQNQQCAVGAVNAFYADSDKNIYFCPSNVSRESDVIYHEYTHGVVHHIPNYNLPYQDESGAIDEGIADYFAAAKNGDPAIGEGLGTPLRTITEVVNYSNKCYAEISTCSAGQYEVRSTDPQRKNDYGYVHANSLVPSGALWNLRQNQGLSASDVDRLVFDTLILRKPLTFIELLNGLVAQDGGAHASQIRAAFASRGVGSVGSCSYSLTPSTQIFIASASSGSFAVSTSSSCSWTAISNVSWLTANSSGTGNGTVNYSVIANTGNARTGTITVGGQTFTVFQSAGNGSGCPSTTMTIGQTRNATLTTGCVFTGTSRYVDLYDFSGVAGQQIVITMNSTAFDTYLFLNGPDNRTIAQDDDGGGNTNSRIPANVGVFTLPASGTYRIFATSYSVDGTAGSTGAYSISLLSGSAGSNVQLSATLFTVNESAGTASIVITRTGNTTSAASVKYVTSDPAGSQNCSVLNGIASAKCDYIASLGTINFATGQSSKTIDVLIVNDSHAEGNENFTISLSSPTGSSLGAPSSATVTIVDNDPVPGANPIIQPGFYVTEHYYDFFSRVPDSAGLSFWTNQITSCGTDQACVDLKRTNVSGAFYLSIEFQGTGYLVERIYKTAYGDAQGTSTFNGAHQLAVPIVRLNEFLPDTQAIGQGVVVNQTGWEQALENNKQAFAAEFVQRSRFTTAFPSSMTPAQFVDKLNANAGNPLSTSERNQLVNDLTNGVKTRAQVLRAVAEDQDLSDAEFRRAFVLMQFFGYLRRNPNDPQDTDYTGYDFWLTKLNQFNGNFVNAEMVKAFIVSGEYRGRFGP
jgi:hypothetical protein